MEKEENRKRGIQTIKERTGNLDIHKNWYYHQLKAPFKKNRINFQ